MAHRVTRPSNANAHPGLVDRNPPRRTREELQAERETKAAAIAQAEAEKRASLDRLAAVERADRDKVMAMDDEANNPRKPATQARVRRLRKRPVDTEEGSQQVFE